MSQTQVRRRSACGMKREDDSSEQLVLIQVEISQVPHFYLNVLSSCRSMKVNLYFSSLHMVWYILTFLSVAAHHGAETRACRRWQLSSIEYITLGWLIESAWDSAAHNVTPRFGLLRRRETWRGKPSRLSVRSYPVCHRSFAGFWGDCQTL